MKGRAGYWDNDRHAKESLLEIMWRAGSSAGEIASALQDQFGGNPTSNAVVGKVHRLGLPMHQDSNRWRGEPSGRERA